MSGTYRIDSSLFPRNPIGKRWTRQQVAVSGVGEAIYSDFWQVELSFGALETDPDIAFFEGKWLVGGLHNATLPHPKTGVLTTFTGTNIRDFSYDFTDVDSDGWADGARMVIDHISLSATGTA